MSLSRSPCDAGRYILTSLPSIQLPPHRCVVRPSPLELSDSDRPDLLNTYPSIGKKSGFGGVILHGLASFGYATRAVIERVAGGGLAALKGIGGRFSSPVVPGDVLETSIWELGASPDGTAELAFVTKNLRTGKTALSSGIAFVKKAEKSKL